ncbi:putative PurR-regulated permease PerM [Flavobacterium aquaticum]|uniref:Putative PurR-regulated permease PerM n=1 Tax=Flavobacterium aquaticum TaxID=1236486 RepID=A0A327YLC2_9FLAO|nr:AI-2E family transporter [Flavobacterium aquaticum]RAK21768.1 putative PurR-regulated permease PerM [Flavobacterium aquaticum]
MTSKELSFGIVRAVAIIASILLLLFFLYKVATVIVYCIVSVVFSLLLYPLVLFLRRKLKFRNTLAVVVSLLLVIFLISGIVLLFVPLIISQGENLSLLDINSLENNYNRLLNDVTIYLNSHNIDLQQIAKSSNLTSFSNFEFIPNFLNNIVSTVGNIGMGLASVLFISFFILKERSSFSIAFKNILPVNQKEKVLNSVEKINEMLSKYFLGLLLQLFIILVLYFIVFLIFGVENALIIALLCAVFNIVPYVGPIIATFVAGILIMISSIGTGADFASETLPTTIYVLIGMFVVQLIDNNISSPLIFSKSTNSHPLEIFLVILIAGILFGITGMIIAVPFYTSLKVIGKEFLPENKIIKALTKNL